MAKISRHARRINNSAVSASGTGRLNLRGSGKTARAVLHTAARNRVLNRNGTGDRLACVAIVNSVCNRGLVRTRIVQNNSAQRRFSNRKGGGSQCWRGSGYGYAAAPEQSARVIGSAGVPSIVVSPEIELSSRHRIENRLSPGFRGRNNCRGKGKRIDAGTVNRRVPGIAAAIVCRRR